MPTLQGLHHNGLMQNKLAKQKLLIKWFIPRNITDVQVKKPYFHIKTYASEHLLLQSLFLHCILQRIKNIIAESILIGSSSFLSSDIII